MTDAFVYDHVRTPRGRGKPDGALHEVTALDLATHALAAIKERNTLEPMLVDDVAIDFPDLKINMSHTGWPWTGEFCSMIWRHPNVYGDISAYFPATLDKDLVAFMDSSSRLFQT